TYVAEHAPANRRGYFTSWIQTTATLGLFLSLGVILFTRSEMGVEKFNAWGWRIPFLASALLLGISIYIRLKMNESPLFAKLKQEGKTSVNPLKESFTHKLNLKMVLLALFGATMGQGVIWYTGQFYAQSFIENTCKISFEQSRTIMLWAIAFATPFFIVFGALSDKVGRKWIMLAGMLLGVIFYRPIFNIFLAETNVKEWTAGKEVIKIKSDTIKKEHDGKLLSEISTQYKTYYGAKFTEQRTDTIHNSIPDIATGKTSYINLELNTPTYIEFIALIWLMVLFVTMVYGPIAAFLVELFPTRIRYTSMSLPYHIGNGVFGGLVPFLSTLIIEYTKTPDNPKGSPLAGLWYPICVAAVCFVIGVLYLSNKKDEEIMDDENVYVHEKKV
ncbi:MAG TPA: MFS transporter, partial [Chitinophagaceae bacterium]|nr:MFS transporter [Chitinophagaceae bacterium]